MQISYYGKSFFEIGAKGDGNNETIVVINPFDKSSKLKSPNIQSDILLLTDPEKKLSDIQEKIGKPFLINQPGEYERKGVFIKAIAFLGQGKFFNIIYKLECERIKICYLLDFSEEKLSSEQLEQIGQVDILIIPVGKDSDTELLSTKAKVKMKALPSSLKEAATVISQIEPRIVIPMLYDKLDKFFKIMGKEKVERQKKLKISQKNLPKEEIEIVVLER